MAANLAPIYLDNERVSLQQDPKPKVAKIVAAGGKQPGAVEVVRLHSQSDTEGRPVRMDEVIDRTVKSTEPVFLKCVDKADPASAGVRARPTAAAGTGAAGWKAKATAPAATATPQANVKAEPAQAEEEGMEREEPSD